MAEAAGATQQQIALIERGHSDPRLSTLCKIASALGTDIGGLFFTVQEFAEFLNKIMKEDLQEKRITLRELNTYCGEFHNVSPFDPNWSKVTLSKSNKIILKKER